MSAKKKVLIVAVLFVVWTLAIFSTIAVRAYFNQMPLPDRDKDTAGFGTVYEIANSEGSYIDKILESQTNEEYFFTTTSASQFDEKDQVWFSYSKDELFSDYDFLNLKVNERIVFRVEKCPQRFVTINGEQVSVKYVVRMIDFKTLNRASDIFVFDEAVLESSLHCALYDVIPYMVLYFLILLLVILARKKQ